MDSVFFRVTQKAPRKGKIKISVNCFTESNCFTEYKTGFWLYNRSLAPNTWENQQFSQASLNFGVDTSARRGELDRVNVVRVRMVSSRGTVLSDSAYFIGVLGKGVAYPYTLPVVQLLVDSLDAFGPEGFYGPGEGIINGGKRFWNYLLSPLNPYSSNIPRSRIEKKCIIEVLDKENHLSLYRNCGIRLTGLESRNRPNKGMEVVARKEYSGADVFNTTLLGNNGPLFHTIRLRSGGYGLLRHGLGAHEIGETIIKGLNLGDVPLKPVITFLNGSYWSLSFAQAPVEECIPGDNKHRDKISLFWPHYYVLDDSLMAHFRSIKLDTQTIAWTTFSRTGKTIGTGTLLEGNKNLFISLCKRLLGPLENLDAPLTFADLDSLVDLNSWLTYIAVADFGRMLNSIQLHAFMATAPGKKMFLVMDEVKDFAMEDYAGNHWQKHILVSDPEEDESFESVFIKKILLKNKGCIAKLCLLYEDLLNTNFKPERTVSIIDSLSNEFLPEYGKYWRSWKPNAGPDSIGEVAFLESMKDFCRKRPDVAWQQLAGQWLPNDSFNLSDRRSVRIILDSVPAGRVKVHLNSLTITNNWNGLYYPDPALEVSMESAKLPAGFVLAWKEYPGNPSAFKLTAKNEITLTPVLRRVGKKGSN